MMDNYDRTMELVNVAYDSNGKAAEQFGKYSDTLEYKLNQLTNTWEQMRLKFLNSSFLKDTVDMLNNLLKKIQDFSGTDLLKLATVWLTLGRSAVVNFIKGLQQSSMVLQTAVKKVISKAFNSISNKINIGINTNKAEADLAELTKELNVLKNKIIEVDGQEITIGARIEGLSTSQLQNMVTKYESEFNRVQQNAANLGYNSEQSSQYAHNAAGYFTGLTQDEYNAAKKSLQAQDIQKDINNRKKVVNAAASSIGQSFAVGFTSAVTAVTTQESPGEVICTVVISGITAMIPAVATAGSALAAAATAGISLAITGIMAGAAMLWKVFENHKKEKLELEINSSPLLKAQKNVESLKEAHEELAETVSETQSKLSEEKGEYESLVKGKEVLEEYQNQIYLTAEEEENFINTSNELAEQFPELIDYYDEQGNAIMKMGEAWDIAIEKQRQYYAESSVEAAAADLELKMNEYDTLKNQQQVAIETGKKVEEYAQEFYSASYLATDNNGASEAWKYYKNEDGTAYWHPEMSLENVQKELTSLWVSSKPDLVGYFRGLTDNFDEEAEASEKAMALVKILEAAGYTFSEDKTAAEIIEEVADKVGSDMGYADTLKESIRKGLEIIMNQSESGNELIDDIQNANEALNQSINNMAAAQMTYDERYIDSSENVKQVYTQIADNMLDLDYEELKKDFLANSDAAKQYFDSSGELLKNADPTEANKAVMQYIKTADKYKEQIQEVLNTLSEDEQEIIDNYYENRSKNASNISSRLSLIDELTLDNNAKQAMKDLEEDNIKAYNRMMDNMASWTNTVLTTDSKTGLKSNQNLQWFEGLNESAQQSLYNQIEKLPEDFQQLYTESISKISQNIDPAILNNLFTIDLSNVELTNIDELKDNFINSIKSMPEYMNMTTEELESIWNDYRQYCEDYGAIDLSVNINNIESITDSVEEELSKIVNSYNNAADYIETSISNNGLNYTEYQELSDILDEVNLKLEDYTTLQENGKYALDREQMSQAYQDIANDTDAIIANIKTSIQQRINDLQAILAEREQQENLNNQYDSLLQNQDQYNNAIYEGAKMWGLMNHIEISAPATFANTFKQTATSSTQEIKDLIDEYTALLEDDSYLDNLAQAKIAASTEMFNKKTEAVNNGTKALNNNSSASEDAAEAQKELAEAQKELNEALYGTENYENAADHLANYTERLEELTEKANKAKESLEDLGETDSATELLSDYAENVKLENITRTAENQVLEQSMDDLLNILNDKYSEYFQKVGDTWMWNPSIVDAQMNDNEKDYLIESIENLNEYQDQIDENLDAIEEREKEFKEMRKTALDSRITLEEEVVSILEEKYQKEIDATQEKYDALKEADDDYLDALEDAINKQRELRDRANEYEDLAQKERKLALKQRDTSGANKKDTLQLQQEVEESRQNMLDNEVDRLLESMKEMYELQQESREAELEYMNAMVENGQLLQEANEIIASFNTREDMLAWFFENNQELADMSVAATEKYKMELEDMYDAAELYYAMSETNLEELTSFTQEEVADTVATIGETLTLEAERSYNEMRETVDKEVEDAKQAVIDAQKAVEDAAAGSASAVGGAAGAMIQAANDIKNAFADAGEQKTIAQQYALNSVQAVEAWNAAHPDQQVSTSAALAENGKTVKKSQPTNNGNNKTTTASSTSYGALKAQEYTQQAKQKSQAVIASTNMQKSMQQYGKSTYGYVAVVDGIAIPFTKNSTANKQLISYLENRGKSNYYIKDKLNKKVSLSFLKAEYGYLNGGLVDYTGPAWVDGTPSKPEAFLNSDDTKRIGEAAKLLSNLPILNSTSSASTQLSTNIGDTSIEIHINVDSISSDYDVDRLAERIKSDIVDASKPVGTPVILKR